MHAKIFIRPIIPLFKHIFQPFELTESKLGEVLDKYPFL